MHVCARTHTYTHSLTHAHTHMHAHTHTHMINNIIFSYAKMLTKAGLDPLNQQIHFFSLISPWLVSVACLASTSMQALSK